MLLDAMIMNPDSQKRIIKIMNNSLDTGSHICYDKPVIIHNGRALKAWRESQGLTQLELALLIGRNRFTVSKWEYGGIKKIPPYLPIMLERIEIDRKAKVEALKEAIADQRQVKLPLKGSIKTKKRK